MDRLGTRRKFDTKKLVTLALFSALAYVTMLIFHIKVLFLTFEAKDAVITLAAMIYGPLSGLAVSLAVTLLEMVTVSETGIYGWIMNFAAASIFSVSSSFIYRRIRKTWGAVTGLSVAVITMTAAMLLLNLLITPYYMKTTSEAVISLIPGLLLPFNITKATLNAAIVMVLYKPMTSVLRRARLVPPSADYDYKFGAKSIAVLTGGVVVAVACVLVLIFVLGGNFTLT